MIERIDSPANKKVKLAAALKQRKQREKTGLFVAEGIRLCEMAAGADWQIEFGLLTSQILEQQRGAELVEKLTGQNMRCRTISLPRPQVRKRRRASCW